MHESLLFTALMVGFLGGVHCLGMCSGVVGTLSFNLRPEVQLSLWRMFPYQLAYNLGRVTSYALIGALFGWLGHTVTSLATFLPAQQALQIFAGAFMLALGLYVAGIWNGVVVVEKLGTFIWKRLQPVVSKMTSVRTIPQAWLYGMIWGWLPCGLVYSMVIMAISAGGALQGAAVMIAFGLGTMPNLLLMGSFAFFFTRLSRNQRVRRAAGFLIMLMGAWQIWLAVSVHVS
ncbi:sulfite exporter TauE/SafE family protein [Hydrogenovibrio marinus]|uniref:Membrane protein n=1 Tax=Hydrogenovibrio marinus TaxID=28885 RepID=A0A066ZU96_HYDMR|nr:sulfite exporter TauE/SafE family protein [Hydrogenovibrio marinus]KDN95844.1 membrane protein [Hydrogenovibrio marinus]BBN58669.1 cytochrome biogenesis protein [Hydrogenovibrio marinus]